jgi:hypothetical protein
MGVSSAGWYPPLCTTGIVGGARDDVPVTETAIIALDGLPMQAFDALDSIAETGLDADLLALLTRCENAARRLDRTAVSAVAALAGAGSRAGSMTPRCSTRSPR